MKGRSTEGLFTHPTEQWKIALCDGNLVGVLFVEFKKAFECVLHLTLNLKLQTLHLGGSILYLYVNDLSDQIKEGKIDMYADDTTLFCSQFFVMH